MVLNLSRRADDWFPSLSMKTAVLLSVFLSLSLCDTDYGVSLPENFAPSFSRSLLPR